MFLNAGSTLSRAGTSARQSLSNFFGINKESRDIWSEKFQQRINVSPNFFVLISTPSNIYQSTTIKDIFYCSKHYFFVQFLTLPCTVTSALP